jgi:hypothetical protein
MLMLLNPATRANLSMASNAPIYSTFHFLVQDPPKAYTLLGNAEGNF